MEPPKTPGWAWQFLTFSSTIFFVLLLIWGAIRFGYRPILESESKKLDAQFVSLGQQVSPEEREKLVGFYSQLLNINYLLSSHTVASQIFGWLEKSTQVNVYYDRFELNAKNSELKLGGISKTAEDANQQFIIFSGKPEVKRLTINSLSSANNLWRFDLSLVFNEGYFTEAGATNQ